MHPGRSSAKHRRAGKVRQSDARHTRKGQRGGVGIGEGGVIGLAFQAVGVDLVVGRRAVQRAVTVVRCRHHDLERLGVVGVALVLGAIALAGGAFTDVVGERCFTINPEGAEYYLISKLHRRLAARPLISELGGIAQVLNAAGILGVQLELEPLHLAAIDPLGHLRRPRALGVVCISKGLVGVAIGDLNGDIATVVRSKRFHLIIFEISNPYFRN